ncbi:MAG: hypothetical protein ACLSB9_28515 [Hydrogeniiclostridium mannosilyticum]
MTENDTISAIAFGPGACLDGADVTADCQGMYLSPGFIDVHVHGAGGHDFMEGGEAVYTAARCHMLHGTTGIVPTTLTGSRQDLLDFVDGFNQLDLEREGCPTFWVCIWKDRISQPLRPELRTPSICAIRSRTSTKRCCAARTASAAGLLRWNWMVRTAFWKRFTSMA